MKMRYCILCHKYAAAGNGTFFNVPRDPSKRAEWTKLCKRKFNTSTRICLDHFSKDDVISTRGRYMLLPKAMPILPQQEETPACSSNMLPDNLRYPCPLESHADFESPEMSLHDLGFFTCKELTNTAVSKCPETQFKGKEPQTETNINPATPKDPKNNVFGYQIGEFEQNFLNSNTIVMPPQLQEEPIMQMPQEENTMQITVIKSVACAESTQTNTRLCGLVEASDFADEFRFNCFYCSETFPLEKWKIFVNHLKEKHFEMEEAFKTSEYISKDHDYTPINLNQPIPGETSLETVVYNAKSFLVDPLEPTHNPIGSIDLNSFYYRPDENETISNTKGVSTNLIKTNRSLNTMPVSMMKNNLRRHKKLKTSFLRHSQRVSNKKKNIKSKLMSSDRFHLRASVRHISEITPLSRCLKRTNVVKEEVEVDVKEEHETNYISNVPQKPTEIAFGYTPPDIIYSLLNGMKRYPVLWQFDDEPFNQDFFEAVEDLCKIISCKWSLNIDNLKLRRSINRILRYYCYLYPNTNVENIDQFTCYYDKCASFLPTSVNEIAYARCSHCYMCFSNDFDLKLHLVDEQNYLQWPYKCAQCKECFRECDEYEFHKHLPHYDEIFRCEPCNKSFFRRHSYKRHNVERHANGCGETGKYKCDICDRVVQTMSGLRTHKKTHGEKQYSCNLCSKSFFDNRRLKLHLKTHKKEYDFMCEVCGKEFILQSGLRTHMKKHTGEKVTCNICNLKLRKSSLWRHLRTVHVVHEGIVETTLRGKHVYYRRLINPKSLRRIQRKRGEKRKYQCKICKISFENYKLILEHNKELHCDNPRWHCKMCSAQFSNKINVKIHYRRKHKLHVYQVFKLVDENVDLNEVLAIETEHIDKLFEALTSSKNNPDNMTKSNIETATKTELLPDDIYFEEENIYSSTTIQDEIMKAVDDIETQDIMDDMFTDF